MHIKTHLDNTLYLSSLWSDLSCAAKLVIAGAPPVYFKSIDKAVQTVSYISKPNIIKIMSSEVVVLYW